jgi:uncharacterized protein
MMIQRARPGRLLTGRLSCGDDLLDSLTRLCRSEKISAGSFNVIGAVTKAALGYYDQKKKRYARCVVISKKLEIAACMGNISIKEGSPFVHAHIVLADRKGKAFGGHLMPGTGVFAAEFTIQEYRNVRLVRSPDPVTGLPLWQ